MSSRSREYGMILWIGLLFGMLMFIVDSVNGAERTFKSLDVSVPADRRAGDRQ
jgi:hypothetical protein